MLVSSLRSQRLAYLLAGAALLGYAGCSSGTAATTSVTHPTMIEVNPATFLGDVPCATSGNGLRSYVATLYDTNQVGEGGAGGAPEEFVDAPPSLGGESGEGGRQAQELAAADRARQQQIVADAFERLRGGVPSDHFELPSSLPSPCSASVGFGYVVPERRYEVLIEGYDVEPGALKSQAVGSHQVVDSVSGAPVAAKWQAYCARAIPVDSTLVRADQCSPFLPLANAPAPSLSVAVGKLMGSFSCGNGDDQVATLRVTASVGGQSYEQTVDCSPEASVRFEGLTNGSASVYVEAFSAIDESLAGASCDATIVPAQEVTARCRQLSGVGTLRVDVNAALTEQQLSCDPASVSSVVIEIEDEGVTTSLPPPDCRQTFEHGFAPGYREVSLTATRPDGGTLVLMCGTNVLPGKLTVAVCE